LVEALHRARCVLHASREAAGRCTSCEHFYCRECVTTHEGRLQCARCLELAAARADSDGRSWWAAARIAARLVCGVLASWLFFLVASELLIAVPKGPISPDSADQATEQDPLEPAASGGEE